MEKGWQILVGGNRSWDVKATPLDGMAHQVVFPAPLVFLGTNPGIERSNYGFKDLTGDVKLSLGSLRQSESEVMMYYS